jgi:hypothetical protein
MEPNTTQQAKGQPKNKEQAKTPDELAMQKTWLGGGREPIHPDDIDADGEYLGRIDQQPPNEVKPEDKKPTR